MNIHIFKRLKEKKKVTLYIFLSGGIKFGLTPAKKWAGLNLFDTITAASPDIREHFNRLICRYQQLEKWLQKV